MQTHQYLFMAAGLAAVLSAQPSPNPTGVPGPFGFHAGMSRQEATAAVGLKAIDGETTDKDSLGLKSAPKPHPDFSEYDLIIDSDLGLVKLIAVTPTLSTNSFGDELKDKFAKLATAVSDTYGKADKFDYLRSGSIWSDPNDWTTGLFKKERTLEYIWQPTKGNPAQIVAISLEAVALSREAGIVILSYQFENFDRYLAKKKASENSVF